MSPRALRLAALLALLTASASPAAADGVREGPPISRAEVLAESPIVLLVSADKIAHVRGYVNGQRYIERHRLGGKIAGVLRGDQDVKRLLGKKVWLERDNPIVPGKWVVIDRPYPPTRRLLGMLTRGQDLVVYVRDPSDITRQGRKTIISVHELDAGEAEAAVAAAIGAARLADLLARRKGARCKPETWFWDGECRTLADIVDDLDCGDGTDARYTLDDALYYKLGCQRADGTAHGAAAQWDPAGELRWRRTFRDGKQHGAAIDYGDKSRPSLEGRLVDGKRDGVWIARDPASGKELGRYTMKAGTGTVVAWYPNGKKRSEAAYEDGLEHGPRKVWSQGGTLLVEGGAKAGKVHGRFVYYNDDGTPRLAACYRKGKTRWEIDDVDKLPKALKKRCR